MPARQSFQRKLSARRGGSHLWFAFVVNVTSKQYRDACPVLPSDVFGLQAVAFGQQFTGGGVAMEGVTPVSVDSAALGGGGMAPSMPGT